MNRADSHPHRLAGTTRPEVWSDRFWFPRHRWQHARCGWGFHATRPRAKEQGNLKRISLVAIAFVVLGALALAVPVRAASTMLTATLNGANEVDGSGNPNQGDPNGTGTAEITLKSKNRKICSDITVANIALPATAAHIQEAPALQNGPIKVTLEPPDEHGHAKGCVHASRNKIRQIRNNPSGFYVNVHNGEFTAGAVRGQLS